LSYRHPLELIIFSDEEGSLLGSKAPAGAFNKERLKMLSQSDDVGAT
jgi:N-carbamoyl-L-amino-acid hydrolase